MTRTELVLLQVRMERERQDKIYPNQDFSPLGWLPILMEEVGEVAKAICEGDWSKYRSELRQVAAVAVYMIEVLDAKGAPK